MSEGYKIPSKEELARLLFSNFAWFLKVDHGITEMSWDSLGPEEQSTFIKAVDMTMRSELNLLAVSYKNQLEDELANKALAKMSDEGPWNDPSSDIKYMKYVRACYVCLKDFEAELFSTLTCAGCQKGTDQ